MYFKKIFTGLSFYFLTINAISQLTLGWVNPIVDGNSVHRDQLGNIYTAGFFSDTLDFDPGPGVYNMVAKGYNDGFIEKFDSLGNFLWAKQFSESGTANITEVTSYNNFVYLVGSFSDSIDFDPGPGMLIKKSITSGYDNSFILQLDNFGNFNWVKSFETVNSSVANSITTNNLGEIYIAGHYTYNLNIDPGITDSTFYSPAGSKNIFLCKLDSLGNLIFAQDIGGKGTETPSSIRIDNDQNLIFAGNFSDTVDFLNGPGIIQLSTIGYTNMFISKIDPLGNLIWVKQINNTSVAPAYLYDVVFEARTDINNNIYCAGQFYGTADFDPGTNFHLQTSLGGFDAFLLKLDLDGNFIWVKSWGSTPASPPVCYVSITNAHDHIRNIAFDKNENILVNCQLMSHMDVDPGLAIRHSPITEWNQTAIIKLDPSGKYIWSQIYFDDTTADFSSTYVENVYNKRLLTDHKNNIFYSGTFFGKVDFDPTLDTTYLFSGTDGTLQFGFLTKIIQGPCSDFLVNIDTAHNITCFANGIGRAQAFYGSGPLSYTWNTSPVTNDSVAVFTVPGIYTVSVSDTNGCTQNSSILINGPSSPTGFDLNANFIASNFRYMMTNTTIIDGFNSGCIPVNGQLKLLKDSTVSFVSAIPSPDVIIGDTLIWNFTSLTYDSVHINPIVYFTPTSLTTTNISFNLFMYPSLGDIDTVNNHKTYWYTVTNSFDPNDKAVYPKGICNEGYILNDEKLTYTIQFQNTGTADAINIYIIDSLSSNLNLSTLNVVAASHTLITEVIPGNVLKFKFNNIHLPDSTSNEALSHGYLVYEIELAPSLSSGTQIQNDADIYFDYNDPIITNTTLNTIIDSIPLYTHNASVSICQGQHYNIGSYSFYDEGSYLVTIFTSGGCDSLIQLNLNIDSINSTTTQSGSSISANLTGATYQWLNCTLGSSIIAGATGQTFNPVVNGSYAVIVDNGICSDTSSCVVITGLTTSNLNGENYLTYFPVPAGNEINLQSNALIENGTVKILNSQGLTMFVKSNLNESSFTLDISSLPKGIYFVQLIGNSIYSNQYFIKN